MKRHQSLNLKIVLAVCAIILGLLPVAKADENPADTSVALQLKSLAVSAITEKSYLGRITATPYMVVPDAAAVKRVCGRLPRLLDVIVVAFEEQPMRLVDIESDLAGRQDKLRIVIEDTIGRGVFQAFHMVEGSRRRAEGAERVTVEGGTADCQPIKSLPWIKKKPAPSSAPSKAAVELLLPQTTGLPAPPSTTPSVPAPASTLPSAPASIPPSTLSEAELARAEAELLAESPEQKSFPGAPLIPPSKRKSWIMMAIAIVGIGGLMMVIGSYIGYQVAKIRRERRRIERRQMRKDRRAKRDRRVADAGPPASGEKRSGKDRRQSADRRKASDRRGERDRRDEN
ncbi:MAG: hypothetical protein WD075_07995 [Rhodospirillales bacterium]